MFCTNCGKEISDSAVACPYCGTLANSEAQAPSAQQPAPSDAPQTQGVYCTNCGKEISDSAVVCPYCGVLVKSETQAPTAQSASSKKSKTLGILSLVFAGVALLIRLIYQITFSILFNMDMYSEAIPLSFFLASFLFAGVSLTLGIIGFVSGRKEKSKGALGLAGLTAGGILLIVNILNLINAIQFIIEYGF